jgi:hypothetical protein
VTLVSDACEKRSLTFSLVDTKGGANLPMQQQQPLVHTHSLSSMQLPRPFFPCSPGAEVGYHSNNHAWVVSWESWEVKLRRTWRVRRALYGIGTMASMRSSAGCLRNRPCMRCIFLSSIERPAEVGWLTS